MSDSNPSSYKKSKADPTYGLLASQTVVIIFTVLILFAGWSIFMFYGVGYGIRKTLFRQDTTETVSDPKNSVSKTNASRSKISKSEVATYSEVEAKFIASLQRSELVTRCELLSKKLATAFELRKTWDQRLTELKTSDEGSRLATETLAYKYLHLKQRAPLFLHELEQTTELISKIKQIANKLTLPISDFENVERQLVDAEAHIQSGISQFKTYNDYLSAMLRSATQKQPQSLTQMLQQLNELADKSIQSRVDDMFNKAIATQKAEESSELAKQAIVRKSLVNASKNLESVKETTADRIDKSRKNASAASDHLSAERQAARHAMEQELPSMRSMLSPFLSDGYRQPQSSRSMLATSELTPISYSALIRYGALEDNATGLGILFEYGQANDRYRFGSNDRPVGTFPQKGPQPDIVSPAVLQQLKAVQSFLRRHGESLVQAKLLAP
jgi:chromosome segregation ATPase